MTWSTILILFVSLFTILNNVNEPPNGIRQSEYDQYLPYDTSYQIEIVSSNLQQKIVTYIMDYNKNVPITDVLQIAEANIKYGQEFNVDPLLLTAQQAQESRFDRHAISVSGARGICQFMPFNFDAYGISDPTCIDDGARAQARMMKEYLVIWKGNLNYALASYVQGINAIKRSAGAPFTVGTQLYVDKILRNYNYLKKSL